MLSASLNSPSRRRMFARRLMVSAALRRSPSCWRISRDSAAAWRARGRSPMISSTLPALYSEVATPARSPTDAAAFERLLVHLQCAAQIALPAAQHSDAIEIGPDAGLIPDGSAHRQRLFVTRAGARRIAALGEHSSRLVQRPRYTLPVSDRQV